MVGHPIMDYSENLWITLVLISAKVEGIDLSHVPECVLQHYAAQDFTVQEALKALTS